MPDITQQLPPELELIHPQPVGPTKLVIASNGQYDVILYGVGKAWNALKDCHGIATDELCLDGFVEDGIWVVEGRWVTTQSYEGEFDMDFRGQAREPTPEEWASIMRNECPWPEEYAIEITPS
jgi:hypothetical protein